MHILTGNVDGPQALTVTRVWIIYLRYIVDDLGAFGYVYFQGLCKSCVQGVWHGYTGRISGNMKWSFFHHGFYCMEF